MTTPNGEDPRDIWNEQVEFDDWAPVSNRTGSTDQEIYADNLEIAVGVELFNDIPNEQFGEFWSDYIDAFVTNDLDRDEFFEMWDINPRDFPWADWREAMGY